MKNEHTWKRRTSILFLVITVIIASVVGMTGCCNGKTTDGNGAESATFDKVAFVGVRQANQVDPDYSNSNVEDIVYQTAYNHGSVCQISADGTPSFVIKASFKAPDVHIDKQREKIEANNNTEVVMTALAAASAKTPECNPLDGLSVAADWIHSDGGSGIIIIHNSGISTTGNLNFAAADIIHTDPEYIVRELENRHAIPDLTNIRIIWYGMGSVSAPQAELTTEYKYNLQVIWETILSESGADYYIDPAPYMASGKQEALPKVSTMPVISSGSIGNASDLPSVVSFDEASTAVRFQPNTADFLDKTAAQEELAPVANYLLDDTNNHIQVIGSTASYGDDEDCRELSQQRAQACANLLIDCGADSGQITVTGIGRGQNALRTNDLDADGNLIEQAAKRNRAVFFIRE